jgi:hypothetical protein
VRARLAVLVILAVIVGILPAYGASGSAELPHARAQRCAPLAHQSGQHAWFDVTTVNSQLARNWERAICSAADGSTINLAMWFIGLDGRDTLRLIADLKLMHDRHDVHVNVIVGKSVYLPGPTYIQGLSFPALQSALSFAHLMSCHYGCRSSLTSAITHAKFMTISRTRSGVPAVLESSANWDTEQFELTRQSGIYFGNDVPLYQAFVQRFTSMAACARGDCRSDVNDPVRRSNHIFYDKDDVVWRGVAQDAAVYFDPLPPEIDPVGDQLSQMHCHGRGTVDVMTLWLSRKTVITQLRRLRREGCTLRVLVEHPIGTRWQVSNLGERCIGYSHDKLIAVHSGKHTLVIEGSEDWSSQSGWTHDQQVVKDTRRSIWRGYAAYYKRAAAGSRPCTRPAGSTPIPFGSPQSLARANTR